MCLLNELEDIMFWIGKYGEVDMETSLGADSHLWEGLVLIKVVLYSSEVGMIV